MVEMSGDDAGSSSAEHGRAGGAFPPDGPFAGGGPNAGSNGRGRARRGPSRESLERLFDKTPPQSIAAERSLLGSLLLDPGSMADVLALVSTPDDFYEPGHGAIFKAIRDVYDKESTADVMLIGEHLKERDLFDRVGGPGYLVELAESVPSARNAARYAKIVSDKARLRKLIDASGEIIYNAYHVGEAFDEAGEIVDDAESKIFEIASQTTKDGARRLGELLDEEIDRIEKAMEAGGAIPGLPTGFADLDEMLGGLHAGEMVIVAARPSMGKTALALNMAEQMAFGGATPWSPAAAREPTPVGVFSLEMSREGLTQRLISSRSGVAGEKLRRGDLADREWDALLDACGALRDVPLYIDDTPGMTVLQMRARARRMVDQHGVKAIVIDYLQLLTSPGAAKESRQVEVSTISRQIKSLARELRVPVVCLAQLNRGAEQREGHRPRMSDLRESGSIEQDADVIALLHREAYYHRGDPAWDPSSDAFDEENRDKLNTAEVIVAKQRNGPTGIVRLVWDEKITRFKDHDPYHESYDGAGAAGWGRSDASSAPSPSAPPRPDAAPTPTPEPKPGPNAGPNSSPSPYAGAFAPGRSTGPVDDHRDGGGPDRAAPPDEGWGMPGLAEDDELPPF